MNDHHNHNLDYLSAKYAQKMVNGVKGKAAKDLENSLTKTLGVLQENGVYACFLYLLAREKNACNAIIPQMRALLQDLGIENSAENDLEYAKGLTEKLPTLLLAKEALEQTLIYARYGAKARGKGEAS